MPPSGAQHETATNRGAGHALHLSPLLVTSPAVQCIKDGLFVRPAATVRPSPMKASSTPLIAPTGRGLQSDLWRVLHTCTGRNFEHGPRRKTAATRTKPTKPVCNGCAHSSCVVVHRLTLPHEVGGEDEDGSCKAVYDPADDDGTITVTLAKASARS